MAEPRKIVLILGNGFDLDLGLKTSYKDFWESDYCPKNYPAPLIHHLNESWPDSREGVKWYDLENELFNYYQFVRTARSRIDVLTQEEQDFIKNTKPLDLSFGIDVKYGKEFNSLFDKGYIIDNPLLTPRYSIPFQEDMKKSFIWRDKQALELIKRGLCNYLSSYKRDTTFVSSPATAVLGALYYVSKIGDFLDIYTFNYTPLPTCFASIPDESINYVHGYCGDGRIIIGTRDDVEIDEQYDFLYKSFDPSYESSSIVEALRNADEVVFFGHSIGSNDQQYFKAFFKAQSSYGTPTRKNITVFTLNDASVIEIKRALQAMTDNNLSALYNQNTLSIIPTKNIPQDPSAIRKFLNRFIKDSDQVRMMIDGLCQPRHCHETT